MGLFEGIGAALPYLLSLVPIGAAFLIYIYMRRGRGSRVVVPSGLILKKIARPAEARRRFFPPPRFFLELALLILAGLGAADLFKKEGGRSVALLIDDSLSMSAANPETPGESALYSAVDQAHAVLDGLNPADRAAVFVGSESLAPDPLPPAGARGLLQKAAAKYLADDLPSQIQRLESNPRWDRIVVFTDREIELESSGQRYTGRVEIRTVGPRIGGNRPENLAVTGIKYRRVKDGGREIAVEVSVFARNPKRAAVRLISLGARGAPLTSSEVDISPDSPHEFIFSAPESLGDEFKAELRLTQSSSRAADAIVADNGAYITLSARVGELAVVSESTLAEMGLSDFRGAALRRVSPQEAKANPGALASFSGALFYKSAPSRLPPVNSVFVLPPPGGAVPAATAISSAAPTRWRKSHPLLTYADVAQLNFSSGMAFSPLVWTEDILATTAGTIVSAGETNDRKYAFIGFELFPFEGRRSPILSVLALNALKWLSSVDSTQGWLPLGALSADKAKPLITEAGGAELKGHLPGIYRVDDGRGQKASAAFNFISKDESDTYDPGKVLLAIGAAAAPSSERSSIRLIGALAKAALILILLEIIAGLPAARRFLGRSAKGAA